MRASAAFAFARAFYFSRLYSTHKGLRFGACIDMFVCMCVCVCVCVQAPSMLGDFMGLLIAHCPQSLGPVLHEVLSVPPMEGEEDPPLVVAGCASDLLFALMKR